MSVLVKGMEMPKSCDDCPLAGDFHCNLMPSIPALCKEYDIAVQNGKRLNNCPLVEVDGNEIDEAIKTLKGVRDAYRIITEAFCRPPADVVSAQDFRDCRNELCLKCGQYQTKHLGSCNGCRWE